MVSSDEIRKKLEAKRKGIKTDDIFCAECGTKNPADSKFCLECGANLVPEVKKAVEKEKSTVPPAEPSKFTDNHPTLGKIPGFRSGTGWKMILGSVGYFLIVLIAIFLILSALINTDVTTSVNTAMYTDNVAGNTINQTAGNESKFLIMNVSVKNNGNSEVTINPTDFSLIANNESANSQPYIGNTSIESIELAPGENKTMVIAFTVPSDVKPAELEYISLWDLGTEGAVTNIGNIANKTPFDGQYSAYTIKEEYSWSGGSKTVEKSINTSYNFLNQPFTVGSNLTKVLSNGSDLAASKTYNQSIRETIVVKMISPSDPTIYITDVIYITLNTGNTTEMLSPDLRDEDGVFQSDVIINPGFSSIGNDIGIVDSNGNKVGSEKLVRSEVIDIFGKKIDCWVTESKENGTGDLTYTSYYDKTTGLLLKLTYKGTMSGYGQTATYNGEEVIIATNVPLVGVKT